MWVQTVEEIPPLLGLQEATQLFGVASQQSMAAMVRQAVHGAAWTTSCRGRRCGCWTP